MTNYHDPKQKSSPPENTGADDPANANFASEITPPEDFAKNYLEKLNREKKIEDAKNAGLIYFPIGSMKFALLCLCVPFHGYEIWWLYKNFVCQKERLNSGSSPMWRINMLLFYLRRLMEGMREEGKPYGLATALPVEKIIIYWVLLVSCTLFPAPAGFLSIFSFVPLIFVNDYLIKLNKTVNPAIEFDSKFSLSDYLVIIFGGTYLAYNVYLTYSIH